MREIDAKTEVYGLIGDPVAHSRSPAMMNKAFREAGVNAVYAAFRVAKGMVRDALAGFRALGFRGANVTIPHKVDVLAFLDDVDDRARRIGAVNTIVNDGGRLVGYNTDGIGYVRSLKEETGVDLRGKRVLLIGAGGAARGVAFALADEGVGTIWIANRTVERAVSLAGDLARSAGCKVEALDLSQAVRLCAEADVVVNCTSAGMAPSVDETPIATDALRPGMIVSDLVYNPPETKWLRAARAAGAVVHGGVGMFVYQGAYAFEYWTGLPAPVAAMRAAVEASLGLRADAEGDAP